MMNADTIEGLLLQDEQGSYYLISRAQLLQCRVPADRVALLEPQKDEAEVSGYSMSSGGDRPMESLSLNFTKVSWGLFPTACASGQHLGGVFNARP